MDYTEIFRLFPRNRSDVEQNIAPEYDTLSRLTEHHPKLVGYLENF
jgi:hypothetical protein